MSSSDAISPVGLDALAPKVFFLALFILFILYNLYRWLLPKPLPDIPFDSKSAKSLWGDIPSLLGHPVGLNIWTGEHLAKLGAPIGQVLMGPLSKPVVLVADFGDARNMLMSTNDFDRADYIIDRFPLLGGFHFRLKTGSEWKAWRQILQDLMAPRFLHDTVGPIIYRDVIQLIDVWTTKTRLAPNRPFSVVRDLQDVSIDVMVSSLFGKDFEDLAMRRHAAYFADKPIVEFGRTEAIFPRPKVHSFLEELAELANIISSLYAPANWSPKLSSWWLKHVSHRSAFISRDNTIRSYIQRSVQRLGREEPKSGIDHMIAREEKAASKSYRQPAFESQTMVDEIYGNSVAGEHTTAAALTWTVKFMTDYPEVQEKLREELQIAYQQAVQEQRLPTVAEMVATKVPYLEAVLEESLRLRAAFLVPRDTVRDTTLLGHHIPKGTTVLLVAQAPDFSSVPITRNPERYQNFKPTAANDARYQYLQEFQPERWLSKNEAGQFEFDGVFRPQLAFGLGPRGCWGRRLVILEMRMALTMLLWKFDFLPTPPSLSSHDGTYDITFRAKQGFVCLRLRN